jgi:hypothetical protein
MSHEKEKFIDSPVMKFRNFNQIIFSTFNNIKLRTSKDENSNTLVQITLSGLDITLVKVYPDLNSFDNGVNKRTGGLCGNWKKNNFDHVPQCKLYYKSKNVDECINDASYQRFNEEFKTYWR